MARPAPTGPTLLKTCVWACTKCAPGNNVRRRCKHYEVLRLHTLGSAEVLGIDTQVGSLKVGKRADMLLLDPRAFTPWQEPYAALVFAAGVKDIREVFVDGVSLAR